MTKANLEYRIRVTNALWVGRYLEHTVSAMVAVEMQIRHAGAFDFTAMQRCSRVAVDEIWAAAECAKAGGLMEPLRDDEVEL